MLLSIIINSFYFLFLIIIIHKTLYNVNILIYLLLSLVYSIFLVNHFYESSYFIS
nr:MAG TPA: hypothetical protein [Caudoviricetes sp.]